MNLNRNLLGNKTGILLGAILKKDEYIRGISLQKNKIGKKGILSLLDAANENNNLLSIDLRHNSTFEKN